MRRAAPLPWTDELADGRAASRGRYCLLLAGALEVLQNLSFPAQLRRVTAASLRGRQEGDFRVHSLKH